MHAPRTAPWCVLLGDVKTSKMFAKEHCKEASRDQCLAESSATCRRSRERIMSMIMIMITIMIMMTMMMMMMMTMMMIVGLHSRERTA